MIAHRPGPSDPDTLATILARFRKRHVGAARAVTGSALALALGLHLRRVQESIRELRLRGHRIAATSAEPRGYFVARSRSEVVAFLAERHHAQREEGKMLRAFKRGPSRQTTIPSTRQRRVA